MSTRLFLVAISILSMAAFSTKQCIGQEKQEPAVEKPSEETKFLDRMREARDAFEKSNRANADRSEFGKNLHSQTLDIYDIQIEKAQTLIAEGKTFGQTEYSAAMLAIQGEIRKSADRMMQSMKNNRSDLDKINREATQKISEAKSKYEAAMKASNEEFQSKSAIANLKFKFTVNRGDTGIVIWNLPPDRSMHNRSSALVNVTLYSGSESVWNRRGIRLNRRGTRTPIPLPKTIFDRVEIEIPKWTGVGVGLSEIEVYLGKDNIALGQPCKVSSIETLPMHLDDENALTDRITTPKKEGEGYWIAEEKTAATVTIDLLGPKHSSVAKLIPPVNAGR